MQNRPIIIGVTGGSGGGKTSVSRAILDHFPNEKISMIEHDSYYKEQRGQDYRMGWMVIVGSIPIGILGPLLLVEKSAEPAGDNLPNHAGKVDQDGCFLSRSHSAGY